MKKRSPFKIVALIALAILGVYCLKYLLGALALLILIGLFF